MHKIIDDQTDRILNDGCIPSKKFISRSGLLRLVGAGWTANIGYQDNSSKAVKHTGYTVILAQGIRGEFDYLMTKSGKILGPTTIASYFFCPKAKGTIMRSALLGKPLPYLPFSYSMLRKNEASCHAQKQKTRD